MTYYPRIEAKDNADNIVAYFTPEEKNVAACLTIQEIPSRKILRQKPVFNTSTVSKLKPRQSQSMRLLPNFPLVLCVCVQYFA